MNFNGEPTLLGANLRPNVQLLTFPEALLGEVFAALAAEDGQADAFRCEGGTVCMAVLLPEGKEGKNVFPNGVTLREGYFRLRLRGFGFGERWKSALEATDLSPILSSVGGEATTQYFEEERREELLHLLKETFGIVSL